MSANKRGVERLRQVAAKRQRSKDVERNNKWRKYFHGEHVPEYTRLSKQECYSVLQVYHQCPFDIMSHMPVNVDWEAAFTEYREQPIHLIRDFVEIIITECTVILGAPKIPMGISQEVYSNMVKVFNRFIRLQRTRQPRHANKFKFWTKARDDDEEMAQDTIGPYDVIEETPDALEEEEGDEMEDETPDEMEE